MANKNVASGKPAVGGGVYRAPLGTALPTDATTALIAAYKPLGAVSREGLRPTRDTSIEKPRDWNGDVVAQLMTDESSSFAFTLIEVLAQAVNEFVYGTANVTVVAPTASVGTKTSIVDKGGKPDDCILVFEMKHGGKKMRIVIPSADSTVTGEGAWVADDVSSYEITTEAIKDATGNRAYRYYENDDKTG